MCILNWENSVEKKFLGVQPLQVSNLGLGCMGISEYYGKTDDLEFIKTISLNLSAKKLFQFKQHILPNFAQAYLSPKSFVLFSDY